MTMHPRGALLRLAVASLCFAATCPASIAAPRQAGSGPAEVFRSLNADRWIVREVTLAELGLTGPLVLGAPDSRRELYLPVPANVALSGAQIQLNANYMRSDPGRTTLLISLDGYPVSSRPFAQDKGDAGVLLGVDATARPGGFVRLGLDWTTALGADWNCADARGAGNVLRIEPDSRFSYRFDGSAVRDLTTAWGALPATPVILISSDNLAAEAYDSAWRVGVALERAGKRTFIRVLPAVGDVVDLTGLQLPAGLRGVPAFAALVGEGNYKLKDAAELGAYLALGSTGPMRADIVIADKAMATRLASAFDALRDQLQAAAPDAVAPFGEWRARALDAAAKPLASHEIRLGQAFGRPTILVAPDAGVQAAGLFSQSWNRLAVGRALVVQAAEQPASEASAVSLQALGGNPGTLDVLSHADWTATFDIGTLAADGRLPRELILDVAAAPSAARTPPVASVFMNDVLLGARQLLADGTRERISASIPRSVLAARNVLRVSFVRQLASDRCRETPEPYPVSVLASSHLVLEKAAPSDDFTGMVARFALGGHVMVPSAYLAASSRTLPRVVRLAATTGVSPYNARFTAVSGADTPAPGGAFLSLELPFKDASSKVRIEGGRMLVTTGGDKALLDIQGLERVGIVEVVKAGGDTGVMYRTAGADGPAMDKPILLARGDIALMGTNGLLREFNAADPSGRSVAEAEDRRFSWSISRGYWWMLPILAIVFMIALLVLANRMRRHKASGRAS